MPLRTYLVPQHRAMDFQLQLLLQLLISLSLKHRPCAGVGERIVGGTAVKEKTYGYFVRLHYRGGLWCGGSLVRNNAVVTAAHCVNNVRVKELRVHADTVHLQDDGIVRAVKRVVMPSLYNERTTNYDVAVLILDSAVPKANFTAIQLHKPPVAVGTKCMVLGHGKVNDRQNFALQLQEVWVPVLSRVVCQLRYLGVTRITRYMLCASQVGKDACSGDSGGPLVCNGKQAGIVSFGMECADASYPGVYTDISNVYTFIEDTLARYK